ncbi:hypothetical protein V8G61_11940 [Gaetbulibacter sp. M240]|uniref:hypothetical protein n=1 Tax=Gaetbulibacter sp. M240 TaxID=3126511 RepID=UPI00374F02A7
MKQANEEPGRQKKSLKKHALIAAAIGILIAFAFGKMIAPNNPNYGGSGGYHTIVMAVLGPIIVIFCALFGLLFALIYNKINSKK